MFLQGTRSVEVSFPVDLIKNLGLLKDHYQGKFVQFAFKTS